MTSSTLTDAVQDALTTVDTFFDEVFNILGSWAPQLTTQLEEAIVEGHLSDAALAALIEDEALRILTSHGPRVYGTGFCASEDIVATGNPLAWWQGPDHQPLASSTFGVGPGAVDLRRLEWYRVPELTGEATIAGPFVDYLCSNEVTLTSALPLTVHGNFAGVLCLDVLVDTFETRLLPPATTTGGITVTNAHGRVVVSTDLGRTTGDRLSPETDLNKDSVTLASTRYPFLVHGE